MIFKTFSGDADHLSSKIGILGKSFYDYADGVREYKLAVDDLMAYQGLSKKEAKQQAGSVFGYLFPSKQSIEEQFVDVLPEIDLSNAKQATGIIKSLTKQVEQGSATWQHLYDVLPESKKQYVLLGKELEGHIITTDNVIAANQKARQTAIDHNNALKQQTIGAKAATLGMKALALAGNVLLSVAVNALITGLVKLAQVSDNVAQKASELGGEFKTSASDIEEFKKQIEGLYKTLSENEVASEDSIQARKDLLSVQDELIERFGDEADKINLITKAIYGNVDALKELEKAKWEDTLSEFNEEDFWENLGNYYAGYEDNIDRMVSTMENRIKTLHLDSFGGDDKNSVYLKNNDLINAIKDAGYEYDFMSGTFTLQGNLEDVYDNLKKIQDIAEDYDAPKDFINSLNREIKEAKEDLSDYQDIWDNYVLYERILGDGQDSHANAYKAINDAYAAYEEAFLSGDKDAQNKAIQNYSNIFSTAIANIKDDSVIDYLMDLYPTMDAIVRKWEFQYRVIPRYDLSNIQGKTADEIRQMLLTEESEVGEVTFKDITKNLQNHGIVTSEGNQAYEDAINFLIEIGVLVGDITHQLKTAAKFSDFIALENSDGDLTKLGEISESIDKIQNAYSTLNDAIEEYNETGYLSIDTIQEVISLGSGYLEYLVDEEGNIRMDKEALQELTIARLQDMQAQAQQKLLEQIKSIKNETDANNFAAQSYREKAEGINEVTEAMFMAEIATLNLSDTEKKIVADSAIDMLKRYNALFENAIAGVRKNADSIGKGAAAGTKETFDWLETAISRVQKEISKFGNTISATYKKWTTRNDAVASQMVSITEEIALQKSGIEAYQKIADSIDLDKTYKTLVEDGGHRIDYKNIDDETAEKIKEYQEWHEKILACEDAVEELNGQLAELAKQRFDMIATQFNNALGMLTTEMDQVEKQMSIIEEAGYIAGKSFYEELAKGEAEHAKALVKEYNTLNQALNNSGVEKYSDDWFEMAAGIQEVENALLDSQQALIEYANALRELDWKAFDRGQEAIGKLTSESDFLIDLMSGEKLYNENGSLTAEGYATQGLHMVNYDTYMSQARDYAAELKEVNALLAEDPNNQKLLERYDELTEKQREAIKGAQAEKEAIKDLISEGYDEMLSYFDELISARKDALKAASDLRDYQNTVSEQTAEIEKYQQLLVGYNGEGSEETQAVIQKAKDSLIQAEKELAETEYDKYISDQEAMLDTFSDELSQWVNERLDNIDGLLKQAVIDTNAKADSIGATLGEKLDTFGSTLSDSMTNIWSGTGGAKEVSEKVQETIDAIKTSTANTEIETNTFDGLMLGKMGDLLGENGIGAITSGLGNVVQAIRDVQAAISGINAGVTEIAEQEVKPVEINTTTETSGGKGGNNNTFETIKPTTGNSSTGTNKKPIFEVNLGDDEFRDIGNSTSQTTQQSTPSYVVYDMQTDKVLETLSSDPSIEELETIADKYFLDATRLGVKYVKGYAKGVRNLNEDELAWTQEYGAEAILSPTRNAILTPLKKEDTVLTAEQTNRLFEWAQMSPDILHNMYMRSSGSALAGMDALADRNVTNEVDANISFVLPSVENYEQFKYKMQTDPQFQNMVQSMIASPALGRNGYNKMKY